MNSTIQPNIHLLEVYIFVFLHFFRRLRQWLLQHLVRFSYHHISEFSWDWPSKRQLFHDKFFFCLKQQMIDVLWGMEAVFLSKQNKQLLSTVTSKLFGKILEILTCYWLSVSWAGRRPHLWAWCVCDNAAKEFIK